MDSTSLDGIRPAASVIILRSANEGFEVLLLKRNASLNFAASQWVFPGGKIDPDDYPLQEGGTDLGREMEAAYKAAIRECREEANITPANLAYFSTWTAPLRAKPRFRTHFFVATVGAEQEFEVDESEIVAGQWLALPEAAAMAESGELPMMPPTAVTLFELSDNNHPDRLGLLLSERPYFDFAPKMVKVEHGAWLLYAGDSGWESGDISIDERQHRLFGHPDGRYSYFK